MPLPRYNQQTGQLAKPTGGSGSIAAFRQEAAGANNLANQLAQFSNQMHGQAIAQINTEASTDAKTDMFNRKKKIAEIKATDLPQETKNAQIANIVEGRKKSNYSTYGRAYNTAAEAAYSNQVTTDATQAVNIAIEKAKGNSKTFKKIMQTASEQTIANAPSKDTAIVAGNVFGAKGGTAYRILAVAEQKKQRAREVAINKTAFIDVQDQLVKSVGERDAIASADNREQLAAILESGVNNNYYTREEADATLKEADQQGLMRVTTRDVENLIEAGKGEEALQEFIKEEESFRNKLTTEQYDKLETDVYKRYGAFKKQQKISAKEINKEADKIITDATTVQKDGKTPTDTKIVEEAYKLASDTKKQQYDAAKKVNKEVQKYSHLTTSELKKTITEFAAATESTALNVNTRKALEAMYNEKLNGWNSDPITQGAKEGNYSPTTALKISMSAENFSNVLTERNKQSSINQTDAGMGADTLLTKSEAVQYASFFNSEATIEEKKGLLTTIASMGGEISNKVFKQIGGKNAGSFSFAGEMIGLINPDAANLVLQGHNSKVTLDDGITADISTLLSGVFNTSSAEDYNMVRDGLLDYTKGYVQTRGESIDIEDIAKNTIGEIVKYNGKKTILPYGMSKEDFEDKLDIFTIEDRPKLQEAIRDIPDLLWTGEAQLHYAGNGKYKVWMDNSGNGYYEGDKDGKPFMLEIK